MSGRRSVFFIILTVLCLLSACGGKELAGGSKNSDEKVLNVFNWSEYFPSFVIEKFEEETGIKVNYNTYSSNEEMYAKLSAGNFGYDIANVTPNFVEMLIKDNRLEKINKKNIPNLKNIDPEFFGTFADPNDEYTVPYLWGFYLLAVNEKTAGVVVNDYEDLFDPAFANSLTVVDDPRPVIGMMLASLGYSPNSSNEKEIREAGELLNKLKPNIKVFDPDPSKLFVSGEVKAGITYSGDAALAIRENPDVKMVFPEKGLLTWQDSLVIPKDAPHKENAEKFIDFIHRPEIMKDIIMEYPYGTSNVEALKLIPEEVRKEIDFTEEFKRGELLREVGEATSIYDRIWTEFKQ